MRMFDTSAPPTDGPLNPELCPHVWDREPINVGISHETDGEWGSRLGKAFKCTLCERAYLVMYDRAG